MSTNPITLAALNDLQAAISAVCPIDGISVGNPAQPSTWTITFDPSATAPQIAAANAILAAYSLTGESTFDAAMASGITLTWTVSTALNDTYAIDTATQVRMLAERVSIAVNSTFTNGTTTLTWYGTTGTIHTMSVAQAGLFVKAIWQYLTALLIARSVSAGGGTPTWPSSAVSITG
jgi:hypothetical protein